MSVPSRMRELPVHEAVGSVLCHDITQIIPGEEPCPDSGAASGRKPESASGRKKGPLFRKGHVITEADIPALLRVGKEHIFAYELPEGGLHEDEAARRIARAVSGQNILFTDPVEGRINLVAGITGLLKVNVPRLAEVNALDQITVASLHTNQMVDEGQAVAGTRVVPLIIEEERVRQVEALCAAVPARPVVRVLPLRQLKVGVVTTGSEVYSGRIKDSFGPVVREKFARLGSQVIRQILVSDHVDMTVAAIRLLLEIGAEMIVVTGGMSVDPDDRSPLAIRQAGAEIISYGAPVFPGAMFLVGRINTGQGGTIPILGLPGCVMYNRASIFDLVAPRLLAGEEISRADIAALGHGGFCASCPECRFPHCPFGKGG